MIVIILKNVLDLFIPHSVSDWELRLLSLKKNTNVTKASQNTIYYILSIMNVHNRFILRKTVQRLSYLLI